jgi:predicted RNase H-like nuclease
MDRYLPLRRHRGIDVGIGQISGRDQSSVTPVPCRAATAVDRASWLSVLRSAPEGARKRADSLARHVDDARASGQQPPRDEPSQAVGGGR